MQSQPKSAAALAIALAIAVFFPTQAPAEPPISAPATEETLTLAATDALSETDMTQERGGSATVVSDQTLASTSTGNVMNVTGNLTNGAIYTGENFGGSGFGSFVLNTGNNATISSGVSLSVLMLQ